MVQEQQTGGDGQKGYPAQDYKPQVTWKQGQSGNPALMLVQPGKEARELLMRTHFVDENEARDAALFLAWCVEFEVEDAIEELLDLLAAKVSVRGLSRLEYAEVATGIIAPALYNKVFGGKGEKKVIKSNEPTV